MGSPAGSAKPSDATAARSAACVEGSPGAAASMAATAPAASCCCCSFRAGDVAEVSARGALPLWTPAGV